jgi:hypothetical protein
MIASVIAVIVVAGAAAGTAWGGSPTSAVITFEAQQVTLQIPVPPCTTAEPNCVWKFFLNEPKLSVDVATVYGTSGTLTLAYPANFCGVIQADAYVGPSQAGPWVSKRGWQHTIESSTCTTPTPPTGGGGDALPVTPPPAAAPVVVPPIPTTTTTSTTADSPAPQAAAVTPVVAPTVAAASVTPTTVPTTGPATLTSLPFTGANLEPFVYLGLTFVTLGLCLLVRRRKRTL